MDEFVRLRTLESMAISSSVVGAFSLTYGFFEMAGFPSSACSGYGESWAFPRSSWASVRCLVKK